MCVCICKPAYSSSLTDAEWALVEPLLPVHDPHAGGRPLKHDRRLVLDSILYVLVSGCAWRLLPHDLVPWDAAYRWFHTWSADGTWDRVHDALRDRVRTAEGRDAQPSAAVLDAQSVKTHEGGAAIGYDAGKRVRGRKRHLLVDTLGLLLAVAVTTASLQDRPGGRAVLTTARPRYPRLAKVWADGGYANVVDTGLVTYAREELGLQLEIVRRCDDVRGFQVLPRRWVIERSFGWLTRSRRLARDYERKTEHAEAMIKVAMIRLMAARLTGRHIEPHGPIETEAARRLAEDLDEQR